jgi:hypothetical protein
VVKEEQLIMEKLAREVGRRGDSGSLGQQEDRKRGGEGEQC